MFFVYIDERERTFARIGKTVFSVTFVTSQKKAAQMVLIEAWVRKPRAEDRADGTGKQAALDKPACLMIEIPTLKGVGANADDYWN